LEKILLDNKKHSNTAMDYTQHKEVLDQNKAWLQAHEAAHGSVLDQNKAWLVWPKVPKTCLVWPEVPKAKAAASGGAAAGAGGGR